MDKPGLVYYRPSGVAPPVRVILITFTGGVLALIAGALCGTIGCAFRFAAYVNFPLTAISTRL